MRGAVFWPFWSFLKSLDHPRVCGEQSDATPAARCRIGSPPRVRGAECEYLCRVAYIRITPACAGSSAATARLAVAGRDHPRVCGKQPAPRPLIGPTPGSPPRVRGAVYFSCFAYTRYRITPACAGSRAIAGAYKAVNADHPRVCGEQMPAAVVRMPSDGSPPRVRGAGFMFHAVVARLGITPACAGSSRKR